MGVQNEVQGQGRCWVAGVRRLCVCARCGRACACACVETWHASVRAWRLPSMRARVRTHRCFHASTPGSDLRKSVERRMAWAGSRPRLAARAMGPMPYSRP